jgi:hypothetical protein
MPFFSHEITHTHTHTHTIYMAYRKETRRWTLVADAAALHHFVELQHVVRGPVFVY